MLISVLRCLKEDAAELHEFLYPLFSVCVLCVCVTCVLLLLHVFDLLLCHGTTTAQVAVVEHFEESIRLLEILVPTVFEGMSALYAEQGSSRVNTRHIAPSSSSLSASSGSGGKGGGRRRHLLRMAPGHAKPHPGVWSNNHSSSSSPLVDSTQAIKASPSSSSSSSEASLSSAWPLEVADFVREKLHFEQMFYNRMVKRFQLQMAACGVE